MVNAVGSWSGGGRSGLTAVLRKVKPPENGAFSRQRPGKNKLMADR